MKLSELRKELKTIGFKVKITSMSWGKHIDFYNLDGQQRPSIYFGESDLEKWSVLNDWLSDHQAELSELKTEYYGLKGL